MKSLAAAIICIVAASCGSPDKPADPLVGLEASEKVAVLHLNQEDRERYLRDRPLAVIREYLSASQMRPDEIVSDLVAVQRARRSNTESGWRMIMVGGRSVLVFHVSDDRQWEIQVRDRLDDDVGGDFIFPEDHSSSKPK